ncbi:glycosyl transferase family 8 protein [Toxoplasma gondii ARI]|uniref:Glycosyl transferase family 8 protein n=1 Tax=Toxoplasma gondii ARI TaxID=1074872 RepID=A0A139Y7Y6_TOXGO|nr:glycosyl transferase family 8 protein [Toxoplasma gondii ARI]
MSPRYAYATLLTDNSFYYGVEALLKSLEATKTPYPVLLLHTSDVSQSTIKALVYQRRKAPATEDAGTTGKEMKTGQEVIPSSQCPEHTPGRNLHSPIGRKGVNPVSCSVTQDETRVRTDSDRIEEAERRASERTSERARAGETEEQGICVIPRLVGSVAYPKAERDTCPVEGWKDCFTKLRVWEQVDFDVIVYVDADCIVLRPVDELFLRQPLPAFAPDIFPPDKFNAGVAVLKPDLGEYGNMVAAVERLPSYDGGDTGFLNAYFSSWYENAAGARLPFRYNALRTLYHMTYSSRKGYWNAVKPIKILHFCSSPKPWEQPAKTDLEELWWKVFLTGTVPTDSDIV